MTNRTLTHEFVDYIPDELREGVVYVSVQFATAVHLCCCGCRKEVVTPLSPTDWELSFDGKTISLDPSIGNWSYPCQSHYWIRRNGVVWAPQWSRERIAAGRAYDRAAKQTYFGGVASLEDKARPSGARAAPSQGAETIWERLKRWLS